MGWAGSRVVWLSGQPGEQELVTTDMDGAAPQTWTRFDVGDLSVEDVEWSTDYAGTASD